MKPKRRPFTTTIQEDSLKNIKKLAIDLDRPVNNLFEEAIEWLLKKYYRNKEPLSMTEHEETTVADRLKFIRGSLTQITFAEAICHRTDLI